jgi:trans-L-3-hydroxyproline dehydratase
MCGHVTIALGRFLVEMQDLKVFPRRKQLKFNHESKTVQVNLHTPCGLVEVVVPVEENGIRADVTKPVSFICVPSSKVAQNLQMPIPEEYRWSELGRAKSLCINLAYGGAFYWIVEAVNMGFGIETKDYEEFYRPLNNEMLEFVTPQLPALDRATRFIRSAINANAQVRKLIRHPEHDELSLLYSVIVTFPNVPVKGDNPKGIIDWQELGVCFLGNQQLDRLPTGQRSRSSRRYLRR